MKKLVFIKFIKDVLIFFISSIMIMGLIVWTLQAVNYFDFVSEDGHGLKVYFAYTLLNFPKIIHRILPFMFFISLFSTIIKYEINNQLSIFWMNGVSKIRFINFVLFFSIILMLIQIILGSYFSPMSQLKARNLIKESNIDFFTSLIKEGKFINAVKGLTIYIEQKESENFSNIFIDDSTKGLSRMIYAESGTITSDQKNKKFILFDGKVINIDKNRINTFEFDQINFNLHSFGSNSIITPKIQELNSINLFDCLIDAKLTSERICEDEEILSETKQELLKRFFKPIYIPLIAMLCCFLFISGKYKPNYNNIKRYIFLIIFLLIIISETSLRYSTSSNISLILYLFTPFLIFLILYAFSYYKINNV
ncbi:LptF/LptG family permease [Pelagibacterales bacterium SAG-MED09]|nr:LptF/LptG family permease [Pelagibacterales bacterium SAG-MED09]